MKMRALVLLFACTACFACTSGTRLEAERALSGGEHVRLVTLEDQRAALAIFESLSCSDRDVCRVKDACTKVSTPTVAGLEHREQAMPDVRLAHAVDSSDEQIEGAKVRAEDLLARAKDELEAGKNAIPDCEAALAILARAAKNK